VDDNETSPTMSLARRLTVTALVVIVFAAALVIGLTLRSSSNPPLPELAAGYVCVPTGQIPQLQLFIDESGSMSTSYQGFTATFHATITQASFANGVTAGMPFRGTLTMSGGGETWHLPRPASTTDTTINSMCVIASQRETHPSVMIEGNTGGAHCCEVPVIYTFSQSKDRYVKVVDMSPKNYVDPLAFDHNGGFIPAFTGTHVLLSTGDDKFAYAFDCYACSALPIVLDALGANGLVDVTLQYPSLVAANAATLWKSAQTASKQTGAGAFGLLPAWVADECALGRGAAAWSTIERLQRQGELSPNSYLEEAYGHGSYVKQLKAFLLRNDYCIGQI
jgi:hypothetical protein